ncbi:MAG: hypothetical protein RR825_04555 [Ruthenibacterium sp.]
MKPFVFSLERMRGYKEQVLNKEKSLLGNLQNSRNEIERHISDLEHYRTLKSTEFIRLQRGGVTANELADLRVDLVRAEAAVEWQLKVVIAASQELSSLDKLEEKQREDYQKELSRESANQISEYVVSALSRKSGQA